MNNGDAFNLSNLEMGAHTGTHIDAPLHFLQNGKSTDQVPLAKLIGPARVIEIDAAVDMITAAELNKHKWRGTKRILFKTRASYKNWWSDHEFHKDFTAIVPDAAHLLVDAGVEMVGVDYLSAEKFGSPKAETHLVLLGRDVVIVEGLDLRLVKAGDYELMVLPLKLAGREGAPARAVLRAMR